MKELLVAQAHKKRQIKEQENPINPYQNIIIVTCTALSFLFTTPIRACTHDFRTHMQTPKTKLELLYYYSMASKLSLAYILDMVIPTIQAKHIAIAKYSSFIMGSSLIQCASKEVQKGAKLKRITAIYIGTILRTQMDIIKFTLPTIARSTIQGN
jgi:hypothetical protein